jgi:hypothetical protein
MLFLWLCERKGRTAAAVAEWLTVVEVEGWVLVGRNFLLPSGAIYFPLRMIKFRYFGYFNAIVVIIITDEAETPNLSTRHNASA